MRPLELQMIGPELAVKWEDNVESFITLENLRRACPCAGCLGERDVMGNLHKGPEIAYSPASFELRRLDRVGGYAIQPIWADGHASGIFSYEYLRRVMA